MSVYEIGLIVGAGAGSLLGWWLAGVVWHLRRHRPRSRRCSRDRAGHVGRHLVTPDVAGELSELCDDPDGPSTPEVLRAIAAGVRRGGHLAITPGELDEIAAEIGGPPWP